MACLLLRVFLTRVGLLASASAGKGKTSTTSQMRSALSVGRVHKLQSGPDGRPTEMRTLAVKPGIFLVPGLFSEEEADEITALASHSDWDDSTTNGQLNWRGFNIHDILHGLDAGSQIGKDFLRAIDQNSDGFLETEELNYMLVFVFQLAEYDLGRIIRLALGTSAPINADLPLHVMLKSGVGRYIKKTLQKEPWRGSRFSKTTWLKYEEPVMKKLLARAQVVTGLPARVVNGSMPLQIMRYQKRGHFSCHHDVSPPMIESGQGRLATLGIFLSNVSEGGQLAFPAADNTAWNSVELILRCSPLKACAQLGGPVVEPRKGDAVLWYNIRKKFWHQVVAGPPFKSGQGFGEMAIDQSSVHCGAEVIKGTKWFANMWFIPPSDRHGRDEL